MQQWLYDNRKTVRDMVLLTVEGLEKAYGLKQLFSAVSFGIDERDKVGIIGANGSGKSTLLKILAGIEAADAGRVMVANQKRIAYLAQDAPYDPEDTVIESIMKADPVSMQNLRDYERLCRLLEHDQPGDPLLLEQLSTLSLELERSGTWELETQVSMVLGKLGIHDLHAAMGKLSGGQRKRVALALALVSHSDGLILDEPTNHLDADSVEWLEQYIRRYQGAVILITHDRYFLDRVATRMFELDGNRVTTYTGGYSRYLEQKAIQEEQAIRDERKRQALVRQELDWIRSGCKARTTKQKARKMRAEQLVYAPAKEKKATLEINVGSGRLGDQIIEFHRVSKSYGERVLLRDFEYQLQKGDRIGIIGVNGAGKTTLFDMITGRITPDSGSIVIGKTVTIGYYDQESRELDDSLRVIEYIQQEAEQIRLKDGSTLSASRMLERFLFSPSVQYSPVGLLSGGERRRLYLLRQLISSPNLLLLDEPTNDLDIPTLRVLEEFLDSYQGCLMVVSHDRYFLDRTVEYIFAFEENGAIRRYPGNYSLYLEQKTAAALENDAGQPARKKESPPPAPAKPASETRSKGLNSKEKRELSRLEEEIQKLELFLTETAEKLAESGTDFARQQKIVTELNAAQLQLEESMLRWEELAERA